MNTSYLKLVNAFCTAFCLVMGSGQQCQYSHAIQVVDKHVDGKSNQQLCHFENLQGEICRGTNTYMEKLSPWLSNRRKQWWHAWAGWKIYIDKVKLNYAIRDVSFQVNWKLCHFENWNLKGHQHIYGKTITMVVKQKEAVMTRHELGEKYM